MGRVLVVFETGWDRPQLEACRATWPPGLQLEFAAPSDADCPWDLDVIGLVDELAARWRGRLEGVLSTSDYPGATVAACLAARLGLPGPAPTSVLTASHKQASRLAQREVAPEAVPAFAPVDPDDPRGFDPPTGFPCFLKPVKGAYSMMAGPMAGRDQLASFLRSEQVGWFRRRYLHVFHQLLRHHGLDHDGRGFLAEELLHGRQVTVEGWRGAGAEGVLGVVDSTLHPETGSFLRFDYPSDLPTEVQERMGRLALAVAAHLGLDHTLFNVELIWNEATGALSIVEVNPRACGQFADLYRKVDGTGGYEVALALCTGRAPSTRRGEGPWRAAASFPLRAFEPARVARAPTQDEADLAARRHGDALVWIECRPGELLDPRSELEDGSSQRYAVMNVGGRDRADVLARAAALQAALGIELAPAMEAVEAATPRGSAGRP